MTIQELREKLDDWGDQVPVAVGREPYGDAMADPVPLEVTEETVDGEFTVVIRPVV